MFDVLKKTVFSFNGMQLTVGTVLIVVVLIVYVRRMKK